MGKGMRAGKKPGSGSNAGAGNVQKQMQQMQMMQKKMEEVQAEVDQMETTATAGGGAISVTVNGTKQLTKIEIKPDVVDLEDLEMLQDLILVATNEALRQMEEISSNEMNKLTGGFNIPGMM